MEGNEPKIEESREITRNTAKCVAKKLQHGKKTLKTDKKRSKI